MRYLMENGSITVCDWLGFGHYWFLSAVYRVKNPSDIFCQITNNILDKNVIKKIVIRWRRSDKKIIESASITQNKAHNISFVISKTLKQCCFKNLIDKAAYL